jgi:hypothetical protein
MSFINPFEQVPQKKENPAIPALQIYEETCEDIPLTSERVLVLLQDPQAQYLDLVLERIRNRAFEPNDQVRERIKQLLH